MIDHVLIAEDHETANLSVQRTLEDLSIQKVDHAYYCDDALLKIRIRLAADPYDLLITDLHFEADSNRQAVTSGAQLILAARELQPDLRILVFTAEERAPIINRLYKDFQIDAYVRKGRNDAKELKHAIEVLNSNHKYYPGSFARSAKANNAYQFTDFDIKIISLLSSGYHQKDISTYFKSNNIRPASLSSIEKRLNHMKELLAFSKNEQLIAYCKDMGVL
ncbi:MAG: response regulator [Pedobacter sp.]|nr:MAG: response regulator [Pedobacter sp.]